MSRFLNEIMEQPESVDATLSYFLSGEGKKQLEHFRELFSRENPQEVIFTGMGSSYFASYAASCLFNSLRIPSRAVNTSELLHYHFPVISKGTAVVCVSQSGESFAASLNISSLCIAVENDGPRPMN